MQSNGNGCQARCHQHLQVCSWSHLNSGSRHPLQGAAALVLPPYASLARTTGYSSPRPRLLYDVACAPPPLGLSLVEPFADGLVCPPRQPQQPVYWCPTLALLCFFTPPQGDYCVRSARFLRRCSICVASNTNHAQGRPLHLCMHVAVSQSCATIWLPPRATAVLQHHRSTTGTIDDRPPESLPPGRGNTPRSRACPVLRGRSSPSSRRLPRDTSLRLLSSTLLRSRCMRANFPLVDRWSGQTMTRARGARRGGGRIPAPYRRRHPTCQTRRVG